MATTESYVTVLEVLTSQQLASQVHSLWLVFVRVRSEQRGFTCCEGNMLRHEFNS